MSGVVTAPVVVLESTIDQQIERVFGPVADWVSSIIFFTVPIPGLNVDFPLIVGWLVVCGVFFSFYLNFLGMRGVKHAIDLARGKYDRPEADGQTSHFQALSTALTSTLGLGNIAGVAMAITIGGPGAVFWMVLAGFFAMSTKLAECTMGVKFRQVAEDGSVSGGPMYYLRDGLATIGRRALGSTLAKIYAGLICIEALGVMAFQSNQAAAQVVTVAGDGAFGQFLANNKWTIGLFMAVLGGVVIMGGVKAIGRVASGLIPLMALLYITGCFAVIAVHIHLLPEAIGAIFAGAFNPEGVVGGVVGVMIIGFQRAAFSNAAGVGDAAIAHSAVKTDRPATEGFVAAIEPLFDTVILNTISALAIVITGAYLIPEAQELGGVALTSMAFATVASWFPYVLAVAIFFFAFTSILALSYFGSKGLGFLFGDAPVAENVFKVTLLAFTVIGSAIALGPVILLADSLVFALGLVNVIGLYFLAKVIRAEVVGYWTHLKNGDYEADRTDEIGEQAREQRVAAGLPARPTE